jgi:predicted negative regulator of RcsB-dependent stress response
MLNFIKKNLNIFIIIIFLFLVSIFNYQNFLKHYSQNTENKQKLLQVNDYLKKFNFDSIKTIEKIDFFYTPYK